MNDKQATRFKWQEMVPRRRSAIISLILVAIVAFSLGGLFVGGRGSGKPVAAGEGHDHVAQAEKSEPTMWTCSMHPQIQLPKPGKCPICYMDLIPIETGGGGGDLDPSQIRMSETAVKLAGIQTTAITRAFAERSIRMVGKLAYDETRVSYITAWVPGRLDKLLIDYSGARVSKGDHMVRIYSPELIAAQEELLQAKRAVAALINTRSKVLRSTAEETFRSAREKLLLFGLTEDQIESVQQAETSQNYITLTAPASGVVVQKDATEGMYVITGTRIYTIVDLSQLWVLLEAYESDLPWLKNGQLISFTSPAFPGQTFDAIISFIDPVVDPKTRTVAIRAVVSNVEMNLKPEMFVTATVQALLDNTGNTISSEFAGEAPLLIPASAPLITGKRAVVYVKIPSKDGIVYEGREVSLGPRARDHYVVASGLEEGEQVVTNGAFKIDSELQIQARPSMMSRQGGAQMAGHQHRQGNSAKTTDSHEAMIYQAGASDRLDDCEEAQIALIPVYNAYFDVQMALANDDLKAAKSAFNKLEQEISDVDMNLFEGEAHARWMKISAALKNAAEVGKSAGSIVGARDAFFHASLAAIELHDTFGHSGEYPYYLTYCPMARNNAGAYWLQTEDIVWNSFYGDKMLRCGEIKRELPAGSALAE